MALQAQGQYEEALEVYETAKKLDPSNAQLSELAEQCAAEVLTKDRGFSQGQMPFGDMFMKGFGNEKQNPLGLGGLA